MRLPQPIVFDWNDGNIEKNWKKHSVHYKEVEEVFFNEKLIVYKDIKHSESEKRFSVLGITNHKRKLYISCTIRNSKIRVISARSQSRKERKYYEAK